MATSRLIRVNTLWFVTLGVTTLAAAILVYILLIESALGAFSIHDADPRTVSETDRPRVALLNSDYTRQVHRLLDGQAASTARVDHVLRLWREFLIERDRKIPFRDISDADLENGDIGEFDVLVLPSTRALSDGQIQRIGDFMDRGGSVLATGTPGLYDEQGTWRGWGFLEETFGVAMEGFVERGSGDYRIWADTIPGTTPAGLYRPAMLASVESMELDSNELERLRRRRSEAHESGFAPLEAFEWVDSLDASAPAGDFAEARPIVAALTDLDGVVREQDAVAVTFYTWMGGVTDAPVPDPRNSSSVRHFTFRPNTPVTASIPGGYRVKLRVDDPAVKVRITQPERAHSAGFWYDFASPETIGPSPESTSGVVYGTRGRGRFVYLGFERDALVVGFEDREDWIRMADLFANVMNYLRRAPVIWIHDWPAPFQAAAMISGVTAGTPTALAPSVDLLEAEGVPATYFVNPDQIGSAGGVIRQMNRSGDVGVLDVRAPSSGLTARDRANELQRKRLFLESVTGEPVTGYRSGRTGAPSDRVLGSVVDAEGFQYVVADSVSRRTTPVIMDSPFESLVQFSTAAPDDRTLIQNGAGSSMVTSRLLRDGIRRAQLEGGLFNLVFTPDGFGRPQYTPVLQDAARTLKAGDFWIASGDSVAHWWRLHHGLHADVERRGPSRLFVRISNDNGAVAEKATVSISLGPEVESVNIRPELVNIFKPIPDDRDIPPYELTENGSVLKMTIRELKPQQYRIFHIDLLGPDRKPIRNDH